MCDWNVIGSLISAIAASGALAITGWPKFKAWCRKEQKRIRLNHFFHDLKDDLPSRYSYHYSYHGSETLKLSNYSQAIILNDGSFSIRFFYYQKVFFNKNESAKLNGVGLKVGYHLYEIISDDCIRLDFIDDDSGERKSVFIYRYNNVDHNQRNLQLFNKITSWKYE